MTTFNWEPFLRQWSQEALATHDPTSLPNDIQDSGWLGYPSATDAEIAQAESRLNTIFPPSYRAFLKVSNGWRQTTPFIDRLWSTEEIEWFTTRHSDWIEDFIRRYGDRSLADDSRDVSYGIYGADQDCRTLRSQFLYSALEISQKGDSSIYLLNPQVTTENGEWEAWFFGNWLPGADRYRSFEELMQAEYQNFLELRGG
jgi:SMI1 / KNR4 family (SUKH-1)